MGAALPCQSSSATRALLPQVFLEDQLMLGFPVHHPAEVPLGHLDPSLGVRLGDLLNELEETLANKVLERDARIRERIKATREEIEDGGRPSKGRFRL